MKNMTSKWGSAPPTLLSFTGGSGNIAQSNTNLYSYFKSFGNISGHATVAQIKATYSDFNPNLFYGYYYTGTNTQIYYNYLGQSSTSNPWPGYSATLANYFQATTLTDPTLLAPNNSGSTLYYMLPPGTVTGSTGTYGTTYQVPASIGTNPLTATSTTVTQPLNLTYYASLPYGQDVAPGVYTDTVVIQVTF